MKERVSMDELKSILTYDENTGIFTWLISKGRCAKGSIAGRKNKGGYGHIQINKSDYLTHRLAWFYVYGKWPKYQLDHINGDRNDNRLCNLREVSNSENLQNSKTYRTNTSGFPGVSFDKKDKKWLAYIIVNYKQITLGRFINKDDAIEARKIAKIKLHPFNRR